MKLARPARARTRRAELRANAVSIAASSRSTTPSKPPARERALALAPEGRGALPDLLHAEAAISVDEAALLHALSFAFIAGSAGGTLQNALARTAIAASSFSPEALQDGLFLDELINLAFDFPLQGKPAPIDRAYLRRLFSKPPEKREDVELRQAVLRELVEQPALARALEQAYSRVATLPGLLDDEGHDARLDTNQWRLDVLRGVRDAIRALDTSFAGANTSLKR